MTKESKNSGKSSTTNVIASRDKYWKRILIVDDNPDITSSFKVGIENASKSVAVHTHNDPRKALFSNQISMIYC